MKKRKISGGKGEKNISEKNDLFEDRRMLSKWNLRRIIKFKVKIKTAQLW